MKNLLLVLSAAFFLGCSPHLVYHQVINDIPTQAPNYNAEIWFYEDSLPKKPYFEVLDIELVLKGYFNREKLRKRLELEAIKEGVDGIIDIEYQMESYDKITVGTILLDIVAESEEPTTINAQTTYVRGKGIMYLENLGFTKELPEFEYFYKIDQAGGLPEPFLKIEYKLTGQEFKVYPANDSAMDIYNKYMKYYSKYHLFYQRERWEYEAEGTTITKRYQVNRNGVIQKSVVPKYDQKGRISRIVIIHHYNTESKFEEITCTYDDQSRLKSRSIKTLGGGRVFENWIYENGQLLRREIIINEPGSSPLYLRSSILYYHPDYLKDYYFNEYAARQHGAVH